ncbi:MAG: hypothetical protein AAF798_03685 [Bacteroidota bacterium]
MNYINPFDLFGIHSSQAEVVQQALDSCLDQLERSESKVFFYKDQQLDRTHLQALAAELSIPERSAFHKFIQTHPSLADFLTSGTLFFFEDEDNLLYHNKNFQAFVAPYFAAAMNRILVKALKEAPITKLQQLFRSPLFPKDEFQAIAFASTNTYLKDLITVLNANYRSVKWGKKEVVHWRPARLYQTVSSQFRVQALNCLPASFDDERGKIASVLADLAFWIADHFPNDRRYFYRLIQTAHQLEVRPAVRTRLEEDMEKLAALMTERRQGQEADAAERVEETIKWVYQIQGGLIATAASPKQLAALLDEHLHPEDLQLLQSSKTLQRLLVEALLSLSVALWERYEELELTQKALQLVHLYYPASSPADTPQTLKASPAYQSLMRLLPFLKKRLTAKMDQGISLEEANKKVQLLQALFSDQLIQELQAPKAQAACQQLFARLVPVAHQLRLYAPMAVIGLLDHLEQLSRRDLMLWQMTEMLNNRIEKSMELGQIRSVKPKGPRVVIPVRDPLERTTSWQRFGDQMKRFGAFFLDSNTAGPHRLVYFVLLIVLVSGLGFVTTQLTRAFTATYEVPVEPSYAKFLKKKYHKVPKYERERSKYIGNQLVHGSKPFQRCFGEGDYAFGSGNVLGLINDLAYDAVLLIYDPEAKTIVRQAYLRAGEALLLPHIPEGNYSMRFYAGKDWNPLKPNFCGTHGAFDTDPHYLKRSKKEGVLEFTKGTKIAQVISEEEREHSFEITPISARSYFYSKSDLPSDKEAQ